MAIQFKNFSLVIICFVVFFAACTPTKKVINSAISTKDTVRIVPNEKNDDGENLTKIYRNKLSGNLIDFKTMSAKIKVESQDGNGRNPDITAVVRMVKDSAIWVSLSATFLNLEVYRALITKDRIILMDKRAKTVQYRSLDFLTEVTKIPFKFETLQNLLVGNPIFFEARSASFKENDNFLFATFIGTEFKSLLTLSSEDLRLQRLKLDDINIENHRTADVGYSNYEKIDTQYFSTKREITITEKSKMTVSLDFKQIDFNKELSMSFSVPGNYKIK